MIPTTESTGLLTEGLLGVQRLVSECPAFQRRVEKDTAVAAKTKIFLCDYDDSPRALKGARPFAAVWIPDAIELSQVAAGPYNILDGSGQVVLQLTDWDRYEQNRAESACDFVRWVDQIINHISENSGKDDRLDVRGITVMQRPAHNPPEDVPAAGSYWHCQLLLHFGGV